LVFGGLLGAPRYLAYLLSYMHLPPSPDSHDPISALSFYRVTFPLTVQAVLVALPSLWGMRQGRDAGRFTPLLRTVLWSAAIGTLILLLMQEPGFIFFLKAYWLQRTWQGWRILQFVVYWPVVYLVATTMWRRWHHRFAIRQ